jgi:hypothetical protein
MRLHSPKARLLQLYYQTAEMLYREWAGNTLYEKRQTEKKLQLPHDEDIEGLDFDNEQPTDLAYLYEIEQNDKKWNKPGHTGNLRARATNLRYMYPGKMKLLHKKEMSHPEAQEECYKRLQHDNLIECTESPCPQEIFYQEDPQTRELAWDICSRKQDEAMEEFRQTLASKGVQKVSKKKPGMQGFTMRTKRGGTKRL